MMWCESWNELCWVSLYCNLDIALNMCFFWDTVHICKRWVINYCISSIEYNVFDVSVCGLRECAARLTSPFCWRKAASVGGWRLLFWDQYTVLRHLAMLVRWYGAVSRKNGTSFAGLPFGYNVKYISRRIC